MNVKLSKSHILHEIVIGWLQSYSVPFEAVIQASTLTILFRDVNGSINCNVMYVLMAYNRIATVTRHRYDNGAIVRPSHWIRIERDEYKNIGCMFQHLCSHKVMKRQSTHWRGHKALVYLNLTTWAIICRLVMSFTTTIIGVSFRLCASSSSSSAAEESKFES